MKMTQRPWEQKTSRSQRKDFKPKAIIVQRTNRYSAINAAPRVIIFGASGYLGQFLQVGLMDKFASSIVALSSKDADFGGSYEAFKHALSGVTDDVDLVINCAAVSQPGECAKNPERADAINVPRHLVRWLSEFELKPLLIHLSTDQVYDGSKSFWKEDDETKPVNAYGQTKVAGEREIRQHYPTSYAILRSSIIVGPNTPISPITRPLFLQFIISALKSTDKPPSFFHDEFRCPVSVFDIVEIVQCLYLKRALLASKGETFNMGGHERVSRADMAKIVSEVFELDGSRIEAVSSSTVNRGVVSPADISMDSTKLEMFVGRKLKTFRDTVEELKTHLD